MREGEMPTFTKPFKYWLNRTLKKSRFELFTPWRIHRSYWQSKAYSLNAGISCEEYLSVCQPSSNLCLCLLSLTSPAQSRRQGCDRCLCQPFFFVVKSITFSVQTTGLMLPMCSESVLSAMYVLTADMVLNVINVLSAITSEKRKWWRC